MWQNLSDDARNTVAMAMKVADRYRHKRVGPAHFLLGALEQPDCEATIVLVNLGIAIDELQRHLSELVSRQRSSFGWFSKLEDSLKDALDLAELESKQQGRSKIGTEDILVGILKQSNNTAAQALVRFGVVASSTRLEIAKTELEPAGVHRDRFSSWQRFSSEGRTAAYYASQAALSRQQAVVETEHFLLGLLDVPDGLAVAVLNELKIDFDHLRTILEAEVARYPVSEVDFPTLSAQANHAIQFAYAEAPPGDSNLSSHHILLGLMLVEGVAAARILASVGVSLEDLRRAVQEIQQRQG